MPRLTEFSAISRRAMSSRCPDDDAIPGERFEDLAEIKAQSCAGDLWPKVQTVIERVERAGQDVHAEAEASAAADGSF